ncbi:NADH-quinone oxidoreductase subunit H [Saccharothrix saharensis]|uniref:NADH-quinone oxidoreductase subunit H n=1 Tax=Saccharothrix saharensis TaxID=571190 RepID=UPI003688A163
MAEPSAWWGVLLPLLLVLFAVAAASFDNVLAARAAGAPADPLGPLRSVAGLLVQQRRRTIAADSLLRRAGGFALLVAAFLASAATPFGHLVTADLSVGVVWFNAMEVVAWAAVWLVGWGSNSAFGLVAGYRFVALGLAYELPHMFALITAAVGAGSLRVSDIAAAQDGLWFAVWMPVAFVVYLVSVLGMSFFRPFDQAVSREAAGGVLVELPGVDRLVFLAGRWLLLVSGSAMAVPLFLGGGSGPLLPGWLWSVLKTAAVLALLVWTGRRVPTIRVERFQEIAWIVLIPATLVQALVVSIVVVVQ